MTLSGINCKVQPSTRIINNRSGGFKAHKSFDVSKNQKEVKGLTVDKSGGWACNFMSMVELRKKILSFRDIIDLPPCDAHGPIKELLMGTIGDLHHLYPKIVPSIHMSEMDETSVHEVFSQFHNALKSVGDSWEKNHLCKFKHEKEGNMDELSLEQFVERVLARLDYMIKVAKEIFDVMDEEDQKNGESPRYSMFGEILSKSYSDNKTSCSLSPVTPTSVLPDLIESSVSNGKFADYSYSPPLLWPLRLQAVGKLKTIDVKRLSMNMVPNVSPRSSSTVNQITKTIREEGPQIREAKRNSEGLPIRKTNVEPKDSKDTNGKSKLLKSNLNDMKSKTRVGANMGEKFKLTARSAPQPVPTRREPMLPQASSKLNARQVPSPVPTRREPAVLPRAPPPPPQMLSPKVKSAAHPALQTFPPNLTAESLPQLPTLPPPIATRAPPTPPPMMQVNASTTPHPPPPPPPPPVMAVNISTAAAPPPPPMLAVNASKAPPPPPPPTLVVNVPTALPSPPLPPKLPPNAYTPPLPPMMPTNGSTQPPPPPPILPPNASATPPPPPPMLQAKGSVPSPPPPMLLANGSAPPPPPPLGVSRALRPKKANTKLKRSTQMGNLYRLLKGKVEGSSLDGKSSNGKKSQIGGSGGSKQSMADALAEMTKRSAYFLQIEEDVQKYAKPINEMTAAINSFQTKDMAELLKFHQHVEHHLENLTDETQVLSRFDGFPTKKLETLRIAAALYMKLNSIVTNLEGWKIEAPLGKLLERVESYFNKIKTEVDALERTKDDDAKRFQSHSIHFDFNILVKIKESMVDVSSGCMELALKERRQAKAEENGGAGSKPDPRLKACTKMLWRAFQLAFRVYSFAGGQDDRAERLTKELAHEIEADPQHQ